MKGVIYARYSSDNQREESIEGQLRECKDYAERNGITILGTYIDRALSAKTDNRPEFQKMIKDSAKGLFDVVLVWKLDRFARNRYDSARYKNLLKKNGVKVISARENISEGSEGIILEAMLEGYAEYYSAELSEKVIRGLTDNALKCKYNGGTVPMGYYIDEQQFYQIDPKTAPVVLEMFTKYSEGATMQELVNLLNSRGMRSIRGGKITLNIMNHLLKNRRYMGEYSYRDVVKEDGIPAIVPKELFERVQERLAKNKKAPARHKAEDDYLLTTKLYCGKCGSFMVGESGTSHTMKVHRYYRCVNTKKKKLCDKKAVKKDWIEDLVVNYTMKAIMNDEVMERLIDTLMELQKKESTDLPLLKKQLAETEKGINNMLNAIQAGIFTPSTKQRLDELEETKSQLEVSILQEEMHKPLLTREQIAFFIYRFRKFDVTKREQRQRLIDSFVNAVYLYEDKIILTFNYKDGSKTITLADVEGSDLSSFGAPIKELKISSFLIMFWRLQKQRPLLFYYFTVSINLRAISQSAFLTYTRYSYAEFESINGVPCILPGFVIVLVFTVYSIFFSVKIPSTRFKYSKLLVTQISFRLSINIPTFNNSTDTSLRLRNQPRGALQVYILLIRYVLLEKPCSLRVQVHHMNRICVVHHVIPPEGKMC